MWWLSLGGSVIQVLIVATQLEPQELPFHYLAAEPVALLLLPASGRESGFQVASYLQIGGGFFVMMLLNKFLGSFFSSAFCGLRSTCLGGSRETAVLTIGKS